eukprot:scaffold1678_cov110-Isochrysis_galbana.AAC.8
MRFTRLRVQSSHSQPRPASRQHRLSLRYRCLSLTQYRLPFRMGRAASSQVVPHLHSRATVGTAHESTHRAGCYRPIPPIPPPHTPNPILVHPSPRPISGTHPTRHSPAAWANIATAPERTGLLCPRTVPAQYRVQFRDGCSRVHKLRPACSTAASTCAPVAAPTPACPSITRLMWSAVRL